MTTLRFQLALATDSTGYLCGNQQCMLLGPGRAILMTIRSAFRCWHFIFIYLYKLVAYRLFVLLQGRAYQDASSPVLIDWAGTPTGPVSRPQEAETVRYSRAHNLRCCDRNRNINQSPKPQKRSPKAVNYVKVWPLIDYDIPCAWLHNRNRKGLTHNLQQVKIKDRTIPNSTYVSSFWLYELKFLQA